MSNANNLRSGNSPLSSKSFKAAIDCNAAVLDFYHNTIKGYQELSSYAMVLPVLTRSMLKSCHLTYHQTRFVTRISFCEELEANSSKYTLLSLSNVFVHVQVIFHGQIDLAWVKHPCL